MLKYLRRLFDSRSKQLPSKEENVRVANDDRLRAEKRWQQTAEQFGQFVAGVSDYAIFLLDKNGIVLTWNAGAERIKGYRANEIIGRHFSRFYCNDAISSGWPARELEAASITGRLEDEGWRVRKDGSPFWANVVITALRDDLGEVRGFLKITRDLTARKQAEEKLRLSEERFRLIVEGVRDYAIFMLDPHGNVTTWNTAAERLKGYTATEVIGRHFSIFFPEEANERKWPDEELQRATRDGRVEDEGWRVRKDGSVFWVNVVITALRDDDGALRGFVKLTRDLTERHRAEENAKRLLQEEAAREAVERAAQEIERQREQLRVTLASIGDAVIVTDTEGNVTFLNPVAERLTGWEQREAEGHALEQVFNIINEDSRKTVENPVAKVIREGLIVGLANHTALISKDGNEIPIEDSAAPIRDEGGLVTGVVLVFRDVTEARRAMETRQYLAAIVESSDDAIIGQTLDGKIASWNKGAQRLYGYTSDEVLGKPLSILVPPDYPDELPGIMERICRGEYIDHYETERMRKDGTRVQVSLTISPVRNSLGKVIGASKIARDITARKEGERRKDEFIALLAHELRNPLAPLRNGLRVMQLAGNKDPRVVEDARKMMERQLQHLVRLVDDLLDISRISRGKLQLIKERVSLKVIIDSALEMVEPLVRERNQELTVQLPDEQLHMEADKIRMAQALCNLLSNASKYSEAGSCITFTVERAANEAVIHVKDTGIGIPTDMLPKVFELFTQVDSTLEKSGGGLGVGLSIAKRLIEMHGGSIEARSDGPGKGSEFIVRLPVVSSEVIEQQPEDGDKSAPPLSYLRVLVADDNADAAESMALMLKLMGNEVRTARDGLEAMETGMKFRPDMILLDIGMPKLNGYDTCRRIREQDWGKDVVLVALTGWGQDEDKYRSQQAGFDRHLVKPVEPATLEGLLTELRSKKA